MIAIINQDIKNKNDETWYHVQINKEFVCEFYHKQDEGLATCLRKAASAVDQQIVEEMHSKLNIDPNVIH